MKPLLATLCAGLVTGLVSMASEETPPTLTNG